ncbi:MAG: hypothetical protein GX496_04585, partial [Firmicutes bacterium]|nr:hypothetical protein [Bacillota bacterium]
MLPRRASPSLSLSAPTGRRSAPVEYPAPGTLMLGSQLVFRRLILGVAGNPLVSRMVTRHGLSLGARRFVAGETLEEGLRVVAALRARGMSATL